MEVATALRTSVLILICAILLRSSFLGVLLCIAAAVPAGYAAWIGSQQEGQKTYLYGMLLFLGSLLLAGVLLLLWLF